MTIEVPDSLQPELTLEPRENSLTAQW